MATAARIVMDISIIVLFIVMLRWLTKLERRIKPFLPKKRSRKR